jgi:hypothetical protein
MIVDIDDSESVLTFVNQITQNWFSPDKMYFDLRVNGKTSINFWYITDHLLDNISGYLNQTKEEFMDIWDQKCSTYSIKIMGYHCTRHSNKNIFSENGIMPLSEENLKINDVQSVEAKEMWEYRSQQEPGPFFLLSYKFAKRPNNSFCSHGPEILSACNGYQMNADPAGLIPLIIHCAIPYSILPDSDKNYYAFSILKAYFNFIDPDDDSDNLFEGSSIDLKGSKLDPEHIVHIEKHVNII